MDVYSDWIDACENVAQEAAAEEAEDKRFSAYGTTTGGVRGEEGVAEGEEADAGYDEDY